MNEKLVMWQGINYWILNEGQTAKGTVVWMGRVTILVFDDHVTERVVVWG